MPRKTELDYLEEIASKTGSATITGTVTVDGSTVQLNAASLAALENIQVTFPSTQNVSVQNASLAVTGTFFQATQPVSATALPLPAGASSETTLSAVNTKIPSNLTVSSTRLLVDGSGVTQPVSLASVPSHPVTGTFWQATQPVSLATAPTTPVTGTFWQATQPVSLATAPTTPVTDNGGSLTVDGTVDLGPTSLAALENISVNFPATQPVSGSVSVSNFPATQPVSLATAPTTPVTGTFWQATQPVSATALPLPSGASSETTLSAVNTKIPSNLTVSSTRLLVDGSGVTQPTRETQPTSDYVVNISSVAGFSASGSALQSAVFDAGANADYVVFTLSGGGSSGAFYYDLSTNNSTWDVGNTSGGFTTYYDLPATSATDTYSYKSVAATSLFGSTRASFAGRFIVPLTQSTPGIGTITTYRYIRLNLPASNGGWRYRFASYKSVDAVTAISQPGNPSTTRVAGRVDVGYISNLPSLPTGSNTIGSVNVLGGNTTAIKVDIAPGSATENVVTANSSATASTSSQILAARANRKYLVIQNLSDTNMNLNFGAAASASTMLLPANGGGVSFEGTYVPASALNLFCTAASKPYYILEAYTT